MTPKLLPLSLSSLPSSSSLSKLALITGTVYLMGCTPAALNNAPNLPLQGQPPTHHTSAPSFAEQQPAATSDVYTNAAFAEGPFQPPKINPEQAYTLAELIDIAQRTNPITRTAWLHAEQAATAAGMTRSAYLPFISAIAIAGYEKHHSRNKFSIWQHDLEFRTRNSASGVVPALVLEWLLFDFGKRKAVSKIAEEMAVASKFALGATHQAVIFTVTESYFQFANALQQLELSKENLKNSQYILEAAEAKYQAGIGTAIEVAQAKQLKAQAKLAIVQREGSVHSSKQKLLSAIGLSPNEQLRVDIQQHPLPTLNELPTEQILQQAVQARPDVQATQATLRAAEAEIDSAKANYFPKIALMGITAAGSGKLNLQGLPTLTPRGGTSAVLLGLTIPVFDGGLRRKQLRQAELEAQVAQETHDKNEHDALKEMYLAGDALRTALEAYQASQALVSAAQTTYDAALEGYQVGLSSMTLLSEAATGLAIAKEAHHGSYAAAQIASATLAFAMGALNQFGPVL